MAADTAVNVKEEEPETPTQELMPDARTNTENTRETPRPSKSRKRLQQTATRASGTSTGQQSIQTNIKSFIMRNWLAILAAVATALAILFHVKSIFRCTGVMVGYF